MFDLPAHHKPKPDHRTPFDGSRVTLSEGIGTEPASEQVSEGAEGGSFWDLKPVDEG